VVRRNSCRSTVSVRPGRYASAQGGRDGRLSGAVDAVADGGQVEAQAAPRAAEPDGAELAGVGVDPVAFDAEQRGYLRGVNQPLASRPWFGQAVGEQLGDSLGDRLDVLGVEGHGCP
jgi:hypothetical protein